MNLKTDNITAYRNQKKQISNRDGKNSHPCKCRHVMAGLSETKFLALTIGNYLILPSKFFIFHAQRINYDAVPFSLKCFHRGTRILETY